MTDESEVPAVIDFVTNALTHPGWPTAIAFIVHFVVQLAIVGRGKR